MGNGTGNGGTRGQCALPRRGPSGLVLPKQEMISVHPNCGNTSKKYIFVIVAPEQKLANKGGK